MEWRRTGARKKHAFLNFYSSVIFMRFCAAQERMILLYKIIELKELKDWNENAQAQGKNMHYGIFFQVGFSCTFARRKNAQFC